MIAYWIFVVLAMVATLVIICYPLFIKTSTDETDNSEKLNMAIYQDKLKELESDLNAGVITQTQFEQSKSELLKGLAADLGEKSKPRTFVNSKTALQIAIVLAVAIPVYTIGISKIMDRPSLEKIQKEQANHEYWVRMAYFAAQRIAAGDQRLLSMDPNRPDRYFNGMIRRVDDPKVKSRFRIEYSNYLVLSGRTNEARMMLEDMVRNQGEQKNPMVLSLLASALPKENGKISKRALQLVNTALAIDQNDRKALDLAAAAAAESGNTKQAIEYLQRLLALTTDEKTKSKLKKDIEYAKALMENPELAKQLIKKGQISGSLRVSKKLQSQLNPNDTIFLFARAMNGPRFPVAVIRLKGSDLPMNFTLDEKNAMQQGETLEKYEKVMLIARVAKGGDARPSAGDLEGRTQVIDVGSENVELVINNIVGNAHPPQNQGNQAQSAQQQSQQQSSKGAGGNSVSGTLSISPALSNKASPNDVVFIFAKAVSGPPMPLAVIRKTVKDLPYKFKLDDSNAMDPQRPISKFSSVMVTARISKSGDAIAKSGDLTSPNQLVKLGSDGVNLLIEKVVP